MKPSDTSVIGRARGAWRRLPRWFRIAAVAAVACALVWLVVGPLIGLATTLVAFVTVPVVLARRWWRLAAGVGGLVLFVLLAAAGVRLLYGGGDAYPSVATEPLVDAAALESLVVLEWPPGNVAVAGDGRTFFAYHPFVLARRFVDATVFELIDGAPVPFPSREFQSRYQGVFGMTVDRQGRLWFTEPAGLDHDRSRLLAFDLATGELVFEHWFAAGEASFAQDLRVTPDGETVILADTGLFRFTPASLIVLDVATRQHHVVLRDHRSTRPQDWVIRTPFGPHKLAYGLVTFSVGVDGIAISEDGRWLYYAAMNHDTLYRVPLAAVRDAGLSPAKLEAQVEAVGTKPLSDGITLDGRGDILVTDVENGGVARLSLDGELETLVSSPQVVWADGVDVDPSGAIVFTDSAIPAYIDQLGRPPARDHLRARGPYHIYRFRIPR